MEKTMDNGTTARIATVTAEGLKPGDVIDQKFPMPDKGIVKWGSRTVQVVDTRPDFISIRGAAYAVIVVLAVDPAKPPKNQAVVWAAGPSTKYQVRR